MGFGTLTPDQVNFTIAVTPSSGVEAPKPGIVLAKDNFLAAQFRDVPYRNYRIHFWIDPKDLKFARAANGVSRDDLRFVAMVYRDDGFVANSISTTAHVQVTAEDIENLMTSGVSFDQTIAVPVEGNFYLRAGVQEAASGRIGAIEVPTAWVKTEPADIVATTAKQAH